MDTMEKIAAAATIVGTVIALAAIAPRWGRAFPAEWRVAYRLINGISKRAFPFAIGGTLGMLATQPDNASWRLTFVIACGVGGALGLLNLALESIDKYIQNTNASGDVGGKPSDR